MGERGNKEQRESKRGVIYIKELKSYVTDREKKQNKTEKREEEAKR